MWRTWSCLCSETVINVYEQNSKMPKSKIECCWFFGGFAQGVQILKVQLQFGDYACFVVRQPVINGTAVADKIRLSAADNTDSSQVGLIYHLTSNMLTY